MVRLSPQEAQPLQQSADCRNSSKTRKGAEVSMTSSSQFPRKSETRIANVLRRLSPSAEQL